MPKVNMKSVMTNKTYMSILIDGNTLKFDEDLTSTAYHGGVRAANELRALIVDRLSTSGIEGGQHLDVLIQIYANGESLVPQNPDAKRSETAKKLFTDFSRGFNNTHRPLSVFEDTSIGGPSGAGDMLLRQLKDSACMKIIIAKPYGPGFQAMIRAQRQNGTLPDKLTEIIVHPQAILPTRKPYPFMAITSLASQEKPTQSPSTQKPSTQNPSTQTSSTQNPSTQTSSTQSLSTQNPSTQNLSNEVGSAEAGATRTPTTSAVPNAMILRNRSGQRVDPRVEAIALLVDDARKRKICYEYALHRQCTWVPAPCPNAHVTTELLGYQVNALQVLARELPCENGNACQNWACCFGHRCPFGERCSKGERCRFSREMHITDLKVVSTRPRR